MPGGVLRRLRIKRSQWWSVKGDARVVRCDKIGRDRVWGGELGRGEVREARWG